MKKFYFLLIALLCSATMAFAYNAQIDGIYYDFDYENKTATVTNDWNIWDDNGAGYTQSEIIIPEKVTYDGVEYTVTSIGGEAFYYCSSLTSITIPNSVTSIRSSAFYGCSSLTSIDVETNSQNYASIDGVLYNKEITTLICCPAGKTSITMPNSVTSIEGAAFYGCISLTSITIPNSVTSIGSSAFYGCSSLTSIDVETNNQNYASIDGVLYNKEITALICCPGGKTSITIPNSITSIGYYAFYGCSSLTSITIPNSVTEIGHSVFYNCQSLTSITIPNSVTLIGEYTFCGCSSLTSIIIPNSVTSIGESAFSGCSSLTSITIPNSVTLIGERAFYGCSSLTSVTIGNSVTAIGGGAFSGCSSLTSITIPNSVTLIGERAFYGCSSLTSVTIGNSVTAIGDYAFYGCSSLTSITIPNSVTLIGERAFYGCSSLTSITIQVENPLTINEYTFKNVSRSVSIKVPCGSKAKYQIAEYWSEFVNYEEVPARTLTVDVNDKTMGFATITKQNSCTDDVAQVQAQALVGYEFVRWSDGATENPHILLVTEDMTITAEFRKIGEEPEDKPGEDEKHNNFIVESADKTQGAVEITITAKAIEGFEFDHWSDGSTENPRVVTLDEDVELYAYFRVAGTGLENSVISSANVYGNNGTLYVEGTETDYHVLDAAGRLVYSGRESALSLPRGVYVVNVGGEVQKVVI